MNFSFFLFFNLQCDIDGIKNLNWSKFIADELHKALLKRKPTSGCLLFYNGSDDAFLLPSLLSFVISLSFYVWFLFVFTMTLVFFLSATVHSCDWSFWTWHRFAWWSFSHQCLDEEADNSCPQRGCSGSQSFFRETTGNLHICSSIHSLLCNCILFSLIF